MEVWQVPEKFRPRSKLIYPRHQTGPGLETEIENRLVAIKDQIKTDLIYCPIKWTAFYCNNGFGSEESKKEMQNYINTLPKDKKFFTVVQYDDGIMVDFPNCLVFSAGGKPDDAIPIPLLCDPHKIEGEVQKDIPISFIANLDTHPIRQEIAKAMYGKEYCYIARHYGDKYVEMIRRSYFTICPRGYGKTSFRMYEAIQLGTIPVYISDEAWLPHPETMKRYYFDSNWFKPEPILQGLYAILQSHGLYEEKLQYLKSIQHMFTYNYVAENIRRNVEYN